MTSLQPQTECLRASGTLAAVRSTEPTNYLQRLDQRLAPSAPVPLPVEQFP